MNKNSLEAIMKILPLFVLSEIPLTLRNLKSNTTESRIINKFRTILSRVARERNTGMSRGDYL